MLKIEKTITSLEVAETTGKRHADVIRDIKNITKHLESVDNANLRSPIESYFIKDEYTTVQGYQKPMYRLTKKGCELFGTRMTGAKGTQFAAFYVERFNDMETREREFDLSKVSPERLQLALNQQIIERLDAVEDDLSVVKAKVDEIIERTSTTGSYGFKKAFEKALGRTVSKQDTNKLTRLLQEDGVLYKTNKNHLRKRYENLGLTRTENSKLIWTNKGIQFLEEKLPELIDAEKEANEQLTLF